MTISFTPYSSIKPFLPGIDTFLPDEDRDRIGSYQKYDEIYWNDETQFRLRVLEGEHPIYIPNARTIVDTTSYYLLKGLQITVEDPEANPGLNTALDDFLTRELFYPRFHTAKHAGVARGDFCLHITANPKKPKGKRLSLNSVDPAQVIPIYDPDDMDSLLRVHIFREFRDDDGQMMVKKLTYEYVGADTEGYIEGDDRRVSRVEGIYKLDQKWWGKQPTLVKTTLPYALLPKQITCIPVYWFQNIGWEGQQYGSSELRGFERLLQGISQAGSDQSAALALEGLGVYATDGGRPVNDAGVETDWEVAPGKVMEVPTGSYFRRVEGLSSMKPSMDHINYIESKLREAGGLSDVALGRVDVQTAQSGIALAIKFIPTLAKIEERDTAGLAKLQQLFYDWQNGWMPAYEAETPTGKIIPVIGGKLPEDRTATINELNNMLDREVISRAYYRAEMQKLGYTFPDDIQDQINEEVAASIISKTPPPLVQNAVDATDGTKPPPSYSGGSAPAAKSTLPKPTNQSNNKNKPNESSGTESGQSLQRQARGGKPQ